jgi:hypothetical protein
MGAKEFKDLAKKVSDHLLSKKSSFQVEDVMRCLWPAASTLDLKDMHRWMDNVASVLAGLRVKQPPVLSKGELEELTAVFEFFDADGSGTISFEEMISSGLLDKETAIRYMNDWDEDGSGVLSKAEFYEMMCPSGYRAFDGAQRATDENGQRVIYEEVMGGWRIAGKENGRTVGIYELMPKVSRKSLTSESQSMVIAASLANDTKDQAKDNRLPSRVDQD